jgi:hypothetical protein
MPERRSDMNAKDEMQVHVGNAVAMRINQLDIDIDKYKKGLKRAEDEKAALEKWLDINDGENDE